MSLTNRIALITGASRGIGKAIAIELGKRGATVVGTATREAGAKAISDYLKEKNIVGNGMVLDVCDPDSIQEAFAIMKNEFGYPTILINNAAINQDNLLLRMSSEQWNKVIDTNLNSIYRMSKACLKPMMKARWGRIISITSVVGVTGNPGQVNYTAAKAGVIGFTKSLAQEMAGFGITANTVAPGFIETDMTRELTEKQINAINAQIPMKRVGQPQDVAYAVGFLAAEEAQYITGQTLHVNGGMCMI